MNSIDATAREQHDQQQHRPENQLQILRAAKISLPMTTIMTTPIRDDSDEIGRHAVSIDISGQEQSVRNHAELIHTTVSQLLWPPGDRDSEDRCESKGRKARNEQIKSPLPH
jgi:hypothetical protein